MIRAPEASLRAQGAKQESYRQVLRSTSLIGGAQAVNMLIGMVRVKLVAALIGPAGVGLMGVYTSITAIASTVAGLGIQTSGVREVAKAVSAGRCEDVARTVTTLSRVCWITGAVGAIGLVVLAPQVSHWSFGNYGHARAIQLLAITVLLGNLAAGQGAAIQGMRRIGDLAWISVLSALIGAVSSIVVFYVLGQHGIVLSLIIGSAIAFVLSSVYARRIELVEVHVSARDSISASLSLMQFGFALVISALFSTVTAYAIRSLLVRECGLAGAGIYSAAFGLSGMFAQFVLGAMGTDFYPRLTAVSDDRNEMVSIINEQTEIGLLLAFPGLLATLVLSPYAIALFYTPEFAESSDLLNWFVVGCMGRVVSWPLGFSLLAKQLNKFFVGTEIAFNCLHLALVWLGLRSYGLIGSAFAFAVLYVGYTGSMLLIARSTIGFSWSRSVWLHISWMFCVAFAVLVSASVLSQELRVALGLITIFSSGVICARSLVSRVGTQNRVVVRLLKYPGARLFLRGLY